MSIFEATRSSKVTVLGRAWIYDDDPTTIEIWEHELEPMEVGKRSGAEWAREHLCECYSDKDLRKLFDLPPEGDFQVLFRGTLDGFMCSSPMEADEWDERFDLDEVKVAPIPTEYKRLKNDVPELRE